jgi:hypothetical protein
LLDAVEKRIDKNDDKIEKIKLEIKEGNKIKLY